MGAESEECEGHAGDEFKTKRREVSRSLSTSCPRGRSKADAAETYLLPLADLGPQLAQPSTKLLALPLDYPQLPVVAPDETLNVSPDLLAPSDEDDDAALVDALLVKLLPVKHRSSERVPPRCWRKEGVRLLDVVEEC